MNNDGNPDFKDSKPGAKSHGEASMREEWSYLDGDGVPTDWAFNQVAARGYAARLNRKVVRRTVSVSQWVEADE